MPISIVVGGQFGSEGKGKTACFFAKKREAAAVVRCGGSNSGHTVHLSRDRFFIFRQLPTASILENVALVLPAGSYISPPLLLRELDFVKSLNISPDLIIDPKAVIVSDDYVQNELNSETMSFISSTKSGIGKAVVARTERNRKNVQFAEECIALKPYIGEVVPFLVNLLDDGKRVLIEGTQGFGLSNMHSPHYPYVTSRDTTAAGFLMETGLSPIYVDEVIQVIRAFPIRVHGQSGPLPKEITWDIVTSESCRSIPKEYTSVTREVRRVARFDKEVVRLANLHNKPTIIVLNHVDYFCGVNGEKLSESAVSKIRNIEKNIMRNVDYIGTSPFDIFKFSYNR